MEEFLSNIINPENPVGFIAAFPLMWIAVSLLLSRWGGWSSLAEYYLGNIRNPSDKWHFQSATMRGMTGYNNVLTVAVGEEGVSFSTMFLFRVGHPELLMPWDQIVANEREFLFVKFVTLSFKKVPGVVIRISKRLSERIGSASNGQWETCFV